MELEQDLQTQYFPKTSRSTVGFLYNTAPLITISYLHHDVPIELNDVLKMGCQKSPLGLNLGVFKG